MKEAVENILKTLSDNNSTRRLQASSELTRNYLDPNKTMHMSLSKPNSLYLCFLSIFLILLLKETKVVMTT